VIARLIEHVGQSKNSSNYTLVRKGIDNLNQYHDLFLQAHVGIVLFKGEDLTFILQMNRFAKYGERIHL
ncbi:MAG: hypothetical protein ACXWCT_13450, partial [Flavitalea sp.]